MVVAKDAARAKKRGRKRLLVRDFPRRQQLPGVPPPDSETWPPELRGERWKPIYGIMLQGKCQLCAYSFGKPKWRQEMDKCDGITRMLLCANHSSRPGELVEVYPAETCRNFKPKRWWKGRSKSKRAPHIPPPLGEAGDPTIRHIPVGSDGLFATVDTADYEKLSQYKWFPMHRGRLTYAFCHMPNGKVMSMHRMLLHPRRHKVVDHIDGNGLNNRRCNLRICDQRENLANTRPPRDAKQYDGTPHYIGVRRCHNKWQAHITYRGKFYHLGLFDDPVEAAKARDKKAYEFWGQYAYLNLPQDYPKPEGGSQKSACPGVAKSEAGRSEVRRKAQPRRKREPSANHEEKKDTKKAHRKKPRKKKGQTRQ